MDVVAGTSKDAVVDTAGASTSAPDNKNGGTESKVGAGGSSPNSPGRSDGNGSSTENSSAEIV